MTACYETFWQSLQALTASTITLVHINIFSSIFFFLKKGSTYQEEPGEPGLITAAVPFRRKASQAVYITTIRSWNLCNAVSSMWMCTECMLTLNGRESGQMEGWNYYQFLLWFYLKTWTDILACAYQVNSVHILFKDIFPLISERNHTTDFPVPLLIQVRHSTSSSPCLDHTETFAPLMNARKKSSFLWPLLLLLQASRTSASWSQVHRAEMDGFAVTSSDFPDTPGITCLGEMCGGGGEEALWLMQLPYFILTFDMLI